jgi:hypothetical protein
MAVITLDTLDPLDTLDSLDSLDSLDPLVTLRSFADGRLDDDLWRGFNTDASL